MTSFGFEFEIHTHKPIKIGFKNDIHINNFFANSIRKEIITNSIY